MYSIGFDIGSSSVKAAIIEIESGEPLAHATSPERELPIDSPKPGFAEQDPDIWWQHVTAAGRLALTKTKIDPNGVACIGLSYQMHGLVTVGSDLKPLRPAIIWCDSRAVPYGEKALRELGEAHCLERLLNSPGNFTASKLGWIAEHEPDIFKQIQHMLLPGDYIALRMTGETSTTVSGLSEGTLWDFHDHTPAHWLLEYFEASPEILPRRIPTFGEQGKLTIEAADALGLSPGTPVSYRAGDQPNNALSLGALNPGEVAATAGTSGVLYAVVDRPFIDRQMRVNSFAHVNHTAESPRFGILLCVNGTGIANSWMKNEFFSDHSYPELNNKALTAPIGSEGVIVLPYGNGAERTLGNSTPGGAVLNLDYRVHDHAHLLRATQEGIACALRYGLTPLTEAAFPLTSIRAGKANMFLSPIFQEAIASLFNVPVQLYDTDGACGAALAAAFGAGHTASLKDALSGLTLLHTVEPKKETVKQYESVFSNWTTALTNLMGEENG
jgi:xylulokinase